MKKYLLTFIALTISILSYSQQIDRKFEFEPYISQIKTISFEVLDIDYDKKLVAFKHVFNLTPIEYYSEDRTEFPCSCNYPGMQDNPTAGVVLGVFDLTNNRYLKVFMIYKPVFDKKDCFDYQTSAKNLDSAKSFFAANNLDISKKPKPILFTTIDSMKKWQLDYDGISFKATSEKNYDDMVTYSNFYANGKVIWSIKQEDFYVMASGGYVEYVAAYVSGDKILFLNKFNFISHLEGALDAQFYDFTKVYSISELKKLK